jgi:hypothetical protein
MVEPDRWVYEDVSTESSQMVDWRPIETKPVYRNSTANLEIDF